MVYRHPRFEPATPGLVSEIMEPQIDLPVDSL